MFVHVSLGCLIGVMPGVKSVSPGNMCMVGRFFVLAALMVLGRFIVVTRSVRVVLCRLLVVLACFLRHGCFPVLVAPWMRLRPAESFGTPTSAKRSYAEGGASPKPARGLVIYPS